MSNWIVAAIAVGLLAVAYGAFRVVVPSDKRNVDGWHHFGQALFGVISAVAIVLAGLFYFIERRDKTKLFVDIKADAHRLWPENAPHDPQALSERALLLSVRVPIENRGYRQVALRCLSIDVLAHPAGAELKRTKSRQDLDFVRLAEAHPIPYDQPGAEGERPDGDIADCLEKEMQRHPGQKPLYMWRRLNLEPGEEDDVYFEMPVSCEYSAVRIIVKIRPKPGSGVFERKTVLPIVDTCRGLKETKSTSTRPVETPLASSPAAADEEAAGEEE